MKRYKTTVIALYNHCTVNRGLLVHQMTTILSRAGSSFESFTINCPLQYDKESILVTIAATKRRRTFYLLVKICRRNRYEENMEDKSQNADSAIELQILLYELIDNHAIIEINNMRGTSQQLREILRKEYLSCRSSNQIVSYLHPYVYSVKPKTYLEVGGGRYQDDAETYNVKSFEDIQQVYITTCLEEEKTTEKLQRHASLKRNLHKNGIRFRSHGHDSEEKKHNMPSFHGEIGIKNVDISVSLGNVFDFLGVFKKVTYFTVTNKSFRANMTIFIFLLLFTSGHASTRSYNTLKTDSCGRSSYLQNWSCHSPEDMENKIQFCEFRQLCEDDEEPKCVPIGKNSVYICVKKNLTCPPGIKWSVFLPQNDHTKLTVQEEECPDGHFQPDSSECIDACKHKHADVRNIPEPFLIVSKGNIKSSTIITCDYTKGYYNNDGICSLDYDLEFSKHRQYYKHFCLNVNDDDFRNPCKEDQILFPDSVCVPDCIEGKRTYEKANCTCRASDDIVKEKDLILNATLRTTPVNETTSAVTAGTNREFQSEERTNWKMIVAIIIGVFLLLFTITVLLCVHAFCEPRKKNNNEEAPNDPQQARRIEDVDIEEGKGLLEVPNAEIVSDAGNRKHPKVIVKKIINKKNEYTDGHRFEFASNSKIQINFTYNRSTSLAESHNGDSVVDIDDGDQDVTLPDSEETKRKLDSLSNTQMHSSAGSDISSQDPEETPRKRIWSVDSMSTESLATSSVSEEPELKSLNRSYSCVSKEQQLETRTVSVQNTSHSLSSASVNLESNGLERQSPDGCSFPKENQFKQEHTLTIESLLQEDVGNTCDITADSARQK